MLVVQQAGVVVALVEILENRAEDFRLFVRERDPFILHIDEVAAENLFEKRRLA